MISGVSALRTAILSLGTLTASVAISFSDVVPEPVANDIFLGFRINGQPDAYLTRLGNYTTYFRDIPEGTTVTLSVTGIGADLTSKFGANWSSNADARWGIFGSSFAPQGPLLFASRERSAPGTPSEAWSVLSTNDRNLVGGQIISVIYNTGGYRLRQATANNPQGTFQTPAANGENDSSSYIFQTTPSIDFSSRSGWSIEGDFADGPNASVLDLYRVGSESVLRIGYFTISSGGSVTFTRQSTTPPPANADTDGDGVPDALEDIAGTSKTDPSDFFRVQETGIVSGNASVSFKPAANRTYKIYYSEDLSSGSWVEISSASPAPPSTIARYVTGSTPPATFAFSDSDPVRRSKAKGFYKIEVSQNP